MLKFVTVKTFAVIVTAKGGTPKVLDKGLTAHEATRLAMDANAKGYEAVIERDANKVVMALKD